MELPFHTWIFNEGLMNNSKKQAAAIEHKWTCEEHETRQTLTAMFILTSQTHLVSVYSTLYTVQCVHACLQMNHFLNERMIEASWSCLVSLSYSVEYRTPDWKPNKRRDEMDGYTPTALPNTLTATRCSIFKSHSHIFSSPSLTSIFMLSPVLFPVLHHSLHFYLSSLSLSVCYWPLLDSG